MTLCSAPANGLSDAHRLVADNLPRIGAPRLVYAEMEDGAVFREKWQTWKSKSGAKWPGMHEFEVGCTLEHAGYALSWLVSLFGPVAEVTAFSALTFPDKGEGSQGLNLAEDFSVGCLEFKSGMVARVTSGFAAPRDRSLTILGDQGSITVRDLWDNRSAVHLRRPARRAPSCTEWCAGWKISWNGAADQTGAGPQACLSEVVKAPLLALLSVAD